MPGAFARRPPFGGVVLIRKVITQGSAVTIALPAIPQTFTDLRIILSGRDTKASSSALVTSLKINSDATSGNYLSTQRFQSFAGASTTSDAALTPTAAGMGIASIPGTTSSTDAIGQADIYIANYSGAVFHKMVQSLSTQRYTSTSIETVMYACCWKSAAPITDLVLTAGGTAFVDGTTACLYGSG